jgi:hypothetical protein
MNKFVLAAAFLAASAVPSAAATEITVEDIGSILNESLALPAQDTPGSGIAFEQFFEFSLPTRETVTVSMSDSATGLGRIVGGELSLNNWTSTAPTSPFQPIGSLIELSPVNNVVGGQEATVTPDVLAGGAYFVELAGVSGAAPIHIAVDGTITGTTVPEARTWVMATIGFGLLGAIGFKRKVVRYAL